MTTEQLLATLKDLATKLSPGYIDRKIEANMKRDKDIFVQFQKDQLAAGLSSLEKQLTPSYLTDSFFKTTKRARQYASTNRIKRKSQLYDMESQLVLHQQLATRQTFI